MANVYVYNGAGGAGTGADWANAYTTLAAALTAKAAGDDFWVAHDHTPSAAAAKTFTSPGTLASPCRIICVNRAGSVPPVSADLRTTASESTTGANSITFGGRVSVCYGIEFSAGGGGANSAFIQGAAGAQGWNFDAGKLTLATTLNNVNAQIILGGSSVSAHDVVWELNNTKVKFGAALQRISQFGVNRLIWKNTPSAIDTAVATPSGLFDIPANNSGMFLADLRGVDLSAITGTLVPAGAVGNVKFVDCKLGAGVTVAATPTGLDTVVEVIRCDSGATNYRTEKYRYEGTQTVETTIVRTGGASDGTTPIAWKIVTTANAKPLRAFESLPITVWNDTTGGALTATVYGIWGGGAVPNNNDIWMEVQYLGSSGSPVASFVSAGLADILAVAAGQPSDSSTWGGSTTKFKMTATFTPQLKGPVTIRIYAGLASSTFYVDPKITIA